MKSTYEASEIIGVSYQTILNWIRKGIFTNVVHKDGWAGRSMMYIPDAQVYVMKAERDSGKKRIRGYPTPVEEIPTERDLRMNAILLMEEKIIRMEMELGQLHVMLDRLKDLQ